MNAHVQIPASVLKSFSTRLTLNENGKNVKHNVVYCLNCDGKIFLKDIKDCNIIQDYYDGTIEKLLSEHESKFGVIKKKIVGFFKNPTNITISSDEIETIRTFFKIYLYRSQNLVEKIEKQSIACKIAQIYVPDITVAIGLDKNIHLNSILDDFKCVKIIYNDSGNNLIVPQQGFYNFVINGHQSFVMPITTKIAIVLTNMFEPQNTILKVNAQDVIELNKQAIVSEFNNNKKAVYAKDLNDYNKCFPIQKSNSQV